jgi:hypothetical protein
MVVGKSSRLLDKLTLPVCIYRDSKVQKSSLLTTNGTVSQEYTHFSVKLESLDIFNNIWKADDPTY